MLNKIRNSIAHNKKVGSLLLIFAVGFVVWGMGLQSLSMQKNYAMKVGGVEISANDYARAYQLAKQQMQAQFGGQEISAELMKIFGVQRQIEQNLTTQALMENYADQNHIFIDPLVVLEMLKQEPAFQKDGKFDKQTYLAALRQAQINPVDFEASLIKQVQANIIATAFVDSVHISDIQLDMQIKHNQERRDAEILTIAAKDITNLPKPTAEELKSTYEEMKDSFKVPESRDFNLLVISKDALAKELTISDEEVKTYYDENKDEFLTKPEYKVQQILVKTPEEAEKVLAIADLKDNFNKYVQEYSQDKFSKPKNGDMGWLSGDIFGADFENFVNSTPKGDVAKKAVKTPFGYHIFKLTDIKEASAKDFNSVKDKIKAEIASSKADELLNDKIDTALDMSSAGEKLENIAKQLGFKMESFKNVKADATQPYIATVFETSEGEISQPIDLEFNATAFVEVTQINEETTKSLDQVKDVVAAEFTLAKTEELMQLKAVEILKAIEADKLTFKQAAKKFKLNSPIKTVVALQRSNNEAKGINNEVATQIFDATTGTVINRPLIEGKDVILVKVTNSYQEKITDKEKQALKQELELAKTNELYSSFLQALSEEYKVERNEFLIKQITK